MTPKEITNFRIDSELLEALRQIRDRDGIGIAEQVRRAIRAWVTSKGIKVEAVPRGVRASRRT